MKIPNFVVVKTDELVRGYLSLHGWRVHEDKTLCGPGGEHLGILDGFSLVPAPGAEGGQFEMHLKIKPIANKEADSGNPS